MENNIVWLDEKAGKPLQSLANGGVFIQFTEDDVKKLKDYSQEIKNAQTMLGLMAPPKEGIIDSIRRLDRYTKPVIVDFSEPKKALLFTGNGKGGIEDFNRYIVEENDRSIPDIMNHKQLIFEFPNTFGASIIQGNYTYGGPEGLFEIGFLKNGELTPLDGNPVRGYLTIQDVKNYLVKLKNIENEGKKEK